MLHVTNLFKLFSTKYLTLVCRKKTYKQKARVAWLKEAVFREWIVILDNHDKFVKCKYCQKHLKAKRSILLQHAKSNGHIKAAKPLSNQRLLEKSNYVVNNTHKIEVCKAEVRQAIFIATHSTFRTSDHMVEVIRKSFSDSKIASNVKLGKIIIMVEEIISVARSLFFRIILLN